MCIRKTLGLIAAVSVPHSWEIALLSCPSAAASPSPYLGRGQIIRRAGRERIQSSEVMHHSEQKFSTHITRNLAHM